MCSFVQRFWPRQFFAVFKAPAAGVGHVFRPGEPYTQMLVVPTDLQYRAEPMDESLAMDRAKQERQTYQLGHRLAKHLWRSDRGHWFDDRYK